MRLADHTLLWAGALLLVSVAFSNALVEIASGALCAALLIRLGIGRPTGLSRTFAILMACWLAACLVSAAFAFEHTIAWRAFWRKNLEYAAIALAASCLTRIHPRHRLVLIVFSWAGLVIGLDGVIQWFSHRDLLRFREVTFGLLTGPFRNPNSLAAYLVAVIPIQLWAWGNATKAWTAILLGIGVGLETLVLVQTGSRAGFLALAVGLAMFVVVTKRFKLFGFLALLGLGLWYWHAQKGLGLRVRLDAVRQEAWPIAWRMFLDHPLIGIGLGTFMANYHRYAPAVLRGHWSRPVYAHNCYLQLLAEGGLVGFGAFLSLVGWVLTGALRVLRQTKNVKAESLSGLVAALVALLVNVAFDTGLYSLSIAALFWFLLGLTAGCATLGAEPIGATRPRRP